MTWIFDNKWGSPRPNEPGLGYPPGMTKNALRGLCRAKGLIDMADKTTRVGRFNLNQKKTTGSVQDIPFTVVGTKTTQQR